MAAAPLVLILGGCGLKSVKMVDEDAFVAMSKRMGKELKSRSLLDAEGDYIKTFSFFSEDYPDIILNHLSPSFLYSGPDDNRSPATFAGLAKGNEFKRLDYGFKIKTAREDITVTMIGIADWDGKGDEWLAACKVEPRPAHRTREYYVAFPAPPAEGQVHGRVIALDECFGFDCRLYISDSKVASNQDVQVSDSVPGLKAVTEPPKAEKGKREGLEERSLP